MKTLWVCTIAIISMMDALPAVGQTAAPTAPGSLPHGSALVIDVKGDVTATSAPGAPAKVQKSQVLPAGSNIETGKGSLVLAFGDGSQVLLKPQCRVTIKAPEQANGDFLELLLGRLLAKVQKRLGQEPSFKLGTPTAVVAVRGTFFGVEVTKKQRTFVQVYEGLVAVSAINIPGPPVMLRPGFATQIDLDQPPQDPHQMQDFERYTSPAPGGEDSGQGARENVPGRPESESSGRSGAAESQGNAPKKQQQQNPQQKDGPD
jgi:ferric-dicitrate binding protein FerR (iron transport regulator)